MDIDKIIPIIWLIAIVLFALTEAASVQLITIWFAVGALIAFILSLLGVPFILQVIIFVVLSLILIAATRPLYHKYIKPKLVRTNADSLIGLSAIVTKEIDNDKAQGLVRVSGQEWSARSINGDIIPDGQKVEVLSIEGVKLIVKPYNKV